MGLTRITSDGITDGTITGTDLATNLDFVDNQKIRLGTSSEKSEIYNDGNDLFINHTEAGYLQLQGNYGVLIQRHNGTENLIRAFSNGAVELFYDNNKKFNTTATGATITGTCNMTSLNCTTSGSTGANFTVGGDLNVTGNIDVADDVIIKLGTSDDLQIYHAAGAASHINATGLLNIDGTTGVRLEYNNATKLEITSAGVTVTGNITVSGTVDSVDIAARDTLFGGLTSSSGVLTNGVTATTQSAGDNSTKVATTAYTDTAISNLVDSSPSALNTLNELAAALGDDANFSTTVTNSIATKLPLAGGTLTGDLTLSSTQPKIIFTDTNGDPDYQFKVDGGVFTLERTAGNDQFRFNADGSFFLGGNFNTNSLVSCGNSLDVTGNISVSGTVDGRDIATDGTKLDGIASNAIANVVQDTTPQLGGDLDTNDNAIRCSDSNGTNNQITFGDSNDLQIRHQSNSSYITNATGNLNIGSNNEVRIKGGNDVAESMAIFKDNGAVELYYDNTKRLETDASGVKLSNGRFYSAGTFAFIESSDTATTTLTLKKSASGADSIDYLQCRDSSNNIKLVISGSGDIDIEDNAKLKLGTSDDLQIYHDGSHSYIADVGTGELRLRGTTIRLTDHNGTENFANFIDNGAVELFHDNSKKFETTSSGATVTGNLNMGTELNMTEGVAATRSIDAFVGDAGTFRIRGTNSGDSSGHQVLAEFRRNAGVHLNHSGSTRFETTSEGALISGAVTGNAIENATLRFNIINSSGAEKKAQIISTKVSDISSTIEFGTTVSHSYAERMRIHSNGFVGIGTAAPVRRLHLHNDSSTSNYLQVTNSTTGTTSNDGVLFGLSSAEEGLMWNFESTNLKFATANTERIRITSGGNLLIGTTSTGYYSNNLVLAAGNGGGMTIAASSTSDTNFINFADAANSGGYLMGGILYQHSTNVLAFRANDAERMRIDSSGRVLIGTTSGSDALVVDGGSDAGTILTNSTNSNGNMMTFQCSGTSKFFIGSAASFITGQSGVTNQGIRSVGALLFATGSGATERMRLDTNGNLGLGTTSLIGNSSSIYLTVNGSSLGGIALKAGGTTQGYLQGSGGTVTLSSDGSKNIRFDTNGSQRMNIASDGNVGIGKTSSSLDIDGSMFFGSGQILQIVKSGSGGKAMNIRRRTNVGTLIQFDRSGAVGSISCNNTSTSYNTSSDYRLKENIVTLSDAITRLKTLKTYRFNFIEDKTLTVDGFLAHEVTAVPEAITGTKDAVVTQAMIDNEEYEKEQLGDIIPQSIDQAKLVPLLVAAVQEAIGKIEVLETEVAALKAS